MQVIPIYKCLSDELRLRILNLLLDGPLCVCHLIDILACDQVKMSKQLRYMKKLGLVEGERQAQWMVYRLAQPDHPLLAENLQCLRGRVGAGLGFAADLKKRRQVIQRLRREPVACAETLLAGQRACDC